MTTPTKEPNPVSAAHTPGPWMSGGCCIWQVNGDMVADLALTHKDPNLTEANVDRIVACVNGCEGIANPEAVKDVVAALEFYMGVCGNTGYSTTRESFQEAHEGARAALAKLKGI